MQTWIHEETLEIYNTIVKSENGNTNFRTNPSGQKN